LAIGLGDGFSAGLATGSGGDFGARADSKTVVSRRAGLGGAGGSHSINAGSTSSAISNGSDLVSRISNGGGAGRCNDRRQSTDTPNSSTACKPSASKNASASRP
jgi:hypothetical protein